MVFFRLGKLDHKSTNADHADSTSGAGSVVSASGSAVPAVDPKDSLSKADRKKKESVPGTLPGANAPGAADARAAGATRAQAGLSVNDFISKTKNQQRQGVKPSGPELIAYARYLGIDPVADHDLLWIAVEALEAPLPSDWTEHFDSNDRVFYYNATTRVSSWTHPLEHIYRETYKTIVAFRNSNLNPAERMEKLNQHQIEVTQMEKDVHKEISQWTEHCDEQGNRFYFNREERQSTWTDPRPAKCQILHLRQKMLHLLQSNSGATAGFSDAKVGGAFGGGFGAVRQEVEDPTAKRPKVGGAVAVEESIPHTRGSSDIHSTGATDHHNDTESESDEDRKKKKKDKKHKKKHKKDKACSGEDNAPIRLGAPMKLGTSQSEPSVGCKPPEGGSGGRGGGGDGMGRSPRSSGERDRGHPALSSLGPLDESGLSLAGRARVKAGIRLAPIGPGDEPMPASGSGVRISASVPSL